MLYTNPELVYFVNATYTYVKTDIHITQFVSQEHNTHKMPFMGPAPFSDTDDCMCPSARKCSMLQPRSQIDKLIFLFVLPYI
jgi:hypothetical protein